MSPIAIAAVVFGLGAAISMAVAGLIQVLFVGIRALQRKPAAAPDENPVLEAGQGGVSP